MAIQTVHERDPAIETLEEVGDISGVEIFHNTVLVATYIGSEKTKGGILITGKTRKEYEYQGNCGLVLKCGPLAFEDDDRMSFGGVKIKPGDWVLYRYSDGHALEINKRHCRLIPDSLIQGRIADPSTVF